MRRKSYYAENPPAVDDKQVKYIEGLYNKSTSKWRPTSLEGIKNSLQEFATALKEEQKRHTSPRPANLRLTQWQLGWALKDNNEFIVIEADKNLGACILLQKLTLREAYEST